MNIYEILQIISVLLMVAGVVLAIVAAYVFKKQNMAEVYDSLLGRNYVQRAEARQKRKDERKGKNGVANYSSAARMEGVSGTFQENAGAQVEENAPANGAPPRENAEIPESEMPTVPLDGQAYVNPSNIETVPLYPEDSNETTVLNSDQNGDFRIVKALEFMESEEIIQ